MSSLEATFRTRLRIPPGLLPIELAPRLPFVAWLDLQRACDRALEISLDPPFWLSFALMPSHSMGLMACVDAWIRARKLGHDGNITEDGEVVLFSRTTGVHTVVDVLFVFDEGHVALIEVGLFAHNYDALRAEAFGLALARWTYGLDVRCPMIPSNEDIYAGKFDAA